MFAVFQVRLAGKCVRMALKPTNVIIQGQPTMTMLMLLHALSCMLADTVPHSSCVKSLSVGPTWVTVHRFSITPSCLPSPSRFPPPPLYFFCLPSPLVFPLSPPLSLSLPPAPRYAHAHLLWKPGTTIFRERARRRRRRRRRRSRSLSSSSSDSSSRYV